MRRVGIGEKDELQGDEEEQIATKKSRIVLCGMLVSEHGKR